ncbi:putative carboxylesterase [Helianthus annuus]|nr:putative carboxylesterase [Helianthus annuus]
MASQSQPPNPDRFKILNLTLNPDGSLARPTFPSSPATPELTGDSQLTLSKDIPLNSTTATFLRLYRPIAPSTQKLPIIIYFHGGGFVYVSAASTPIHLTCSNISANSPALVVSVEYRLAPEHRLPAAYEDGVDAILWVRDQAVKSKVNTSDDWLTDVADFSKVYLMGTSAGGNLVYNAGLCALDLDLEPLMIAGLIIDQPFFGGVERTQGEIGVVDDRSLSLAGTDLMWSLALPSGCDRDHKYCNPGVDQHHEKIERLPACLIRVNGGDLMVDRQKDFANLLESCGVQLTRKFYEGAYHGVEVFDPEKAQILYNDVKNFVLN